MQKNNQKHLFEKKARGWLLNISAALFLKEYPYGKMIMKVLSLCLLVLYMQNGMAATTCISSSDVYVFNKDMWVAQDRLSHHGNMPSWYIFGAEATTCEDTAYKCTITEIPIFNFGNVHSYGTSRKECVGSGIDHKWWITKYYSKYPNPACSENEYFTGKECKEITFSLYASPSSIRTNTKTTIVLDIGDRVSSTWEFSNSIICSAAGPSQWVNDFNSARPSYYGFDNGGAISVEVGPLLSSAPLSTKEFTVECINRVSVEGTRTKQVSTSKTVTVNVIPHEIIIARIQAVLDTPHETYKSVTLSVAAATIDGVNSLGNIQWFSSAFPGQIWMGPNMTQKFPIGTHSITARLEKDGDVGTAHRVITIVPDAPHPCISLDTLISYQRIRKCDELEPTLRL